MGAEALAVTVVTTTTLVLVGRVVVTTTILVLAGRVVVMTTTLVLAGILDRAGIRVQVGARLIAVLIIVMIIRSEDVSR